VFFLSDDVPKYFTDADNVHAESSGHTSGVRMVASNSGTVYTPVQS